MWNSLRRATLTVTVASLTARAANLITDGSGFEAGLKSMWPACQSIFSERQAFPATWAMDATTAAEGRQSLCLDLRFRGRCVLRTRGYVLKPGSEYTLSFYAKASKPVSIPVGISCTQGFYDYGLHKGHVVGTSWQRFSATGTLRDTPLNPKLRKVYPYKNRYYIAFVFYTSPGAQVWLDAIQLEEGGLSPYSPGRAAEVNIAYSPAGAIFHTGRKPAPARILVAASETTASQVRTVLTDSYHERELSSHTLSVDTTPFETDVDIPLLPRGHYRLRAELVQNGRVVDSADRFMAFITPHLQDQPVPASQSFLGVHHGPCSYCSPRGEVNPRRDFWFSVPPDISYGLLRDLGIHWQRIDCLGPLQLAGDKRGDVYTSQIEPFARWLRETYDIKLMPTIFHATAGAPDWVRSDQRSAARDTFLFALDGVALYTRTLVASCPSIDCWETANEPNCQMSAREFFDMNKVVYETIKSINPDATVVGFSTTGDLGADVRLAFSQAIDLKTADYVDVVSAHGRYGSRPLGAKELIESCRRDGRPAWNTELRVDSNPQYDFPTMEYVAQTYGFWRGNSPNDHAVKSILLYMDGLAHGIGRTFVHAWWSPGAIARGSGPSWIEYDLSPRPIIPAVDAFTALVDGGVPRGLIDLGGENRCFMVEKGGAPIVLINGTNPATCRLPIRPSQIDILDVMGNPFPVEESADAVTVRIVPNRPLYLVGNGISCATMREALESLPLARTVCRAYGPRLGLHSGQDVVTAQVCNVGATAGLSGVLSVVAAPAGFAFEQTRTSFDSLSLRAATELSLPVRLAGRLGDVPLELLLRANHADYPLRCGLNVLMVPRTDRAPAVDADVSDWHLDRPHAAVDRVDNAVPVIQGMPWQGVADCSARLYAVHDGRTLYLLALVRDDLVMVDPEIGERLTDNPAWSYETDCLELMFDTDLMKDFWAARANSDDVQFLLAPPVDGVSARRVMLDYECRILTRPFEVASRLTEDGYVVEAAIPFGTLGEAQLWRRRMIGFNFAIDDDDTSGNRPKVYSDTFHVGRDIQMKWSGYSETPEGVNIVLEGNPLSHRLRVNPTRYGVLVFTDDGT